MADRQEIALHEAGHALVHVLRRCRFDALTVADDRGQVTNTRHCAHVACILGGAIAWRLDHLDDAPAWRAMLSGSRFDIATAAQNFQSESRLRAQIEQTANLISRSWAAVSAVAKFADRLGRLDEATVCRIVFNNPPADQPRHTWKPEHFDELVKAVLGKVPPPQPAPIARKPRQRWRVYSSTGVRRRDVFTRSKSLPRK